MIYRYKNNLFSRVAKKKMTIFRVAYVVRWGLLLLGFSSILERSLALSTRILFGRSHASRFRETSLLMTRNDNAPVMVGPKLPMVASTTKRLFLVRHGEVINPGGDRPVYYGAMDVPLSPLGKEEAIAAARYLSQFELSLVVSSPLSRAVFGAEQVRSMQRNVGEVVIKEGFKELDRGVWCGLTKEEIGSEAMDRFDACDLTVTPENGESYPFLKSRVLQARDEVLDLMPPGSAAAIVSHLQVTRSMLSDSLGIPTNEMSDLKVATASVTCIDFDNVSGTQTVQFQSFKPDVGLEQSADGAN